MSSRSSKWQSRGRPSAGRAHGQGRLRKGVIAVIAAFALVVLFGFVALAVDTGMLVSEKAKMQNATDAAALAAATEISEAIREAGLDPSLAGGGASWYAAQRARAMAAQVAEANGRYLDPDKDLKFGRRVRNEQTGKWEIHWGEPPFNAVRVTIRRDQPDYSLPDGRVRLAFGWAVGKESVALKTGATAYVDARDMVVAYNLSGSMNNDSTFSAMEAFGSGPVHENMDEIWEALGPPDVGGLPFEPQWLTLVNTDRPPSDPLTTVTFKDTVVDVTCEVAIKVVVLTFYDGTEQEIVDLAGLTGSFKGTGANSGKGIWKVKIKAAVGGGTIAGVLVEGATPIKTSAAQVDVTFYGTSVFVDSSKDLSNVVLQFSDGTIYKFDSLSGYTGTFQGLGANAGKYITAVWVKSGDNDSGDGPGYGERFDNPVPEPQPPEIGFEDNNINVMKKFGLDQVDFPYPSGSWIDFINHCRYDASVAAAGNKRKYGSLALVNYLLRHKARHDQTPDLWKTPHYPLHAVKNGLTLLTEVLDDLSFGDKLGLVSFDETGRVEDHVDQYDLSIDLSDEPLTDNFTALNAIQRRRQAGHFSNFSGPGYGLGEAAKLLFGDPASGSQGKARQDAKPVIVLVSDTAANHSPADWSPPESFSWASWTDFDGDGVPDYSTEDQAKLYAFWQATEAVRQGATIHTVSVGAGADRALMKAIARIGGGSHIDVPGGASVADLDEQLLVAFGQVASLIPSPKLMFDE